MEKLNNLEKEIFRECFTALCPGANISFEQLEHLDAIDREVTDVGFHTNIARCESLRIDRNRIIRVWSEISGVLNDQIPFGANVYIEDRYIVMIEGFVFGHGFGTDWPKNITTFEINP